MALLGVRAQSELPPCCEEGAVAFEQLQSKWKRMAEPCGRDQGYQSLIQLVIFFLLLFFLGQRNRSASTGKGTATPIISIQKKHRRDFEQLPRVHGINTASRWSCIRARES